MARAAAAPAAKSVKVTDAERGNAGGLEPHHAS